MAPIPSSLNTETINLIDNLQRRQKDLDDYQVPRLRDCKGPLSVQQKLAAELKEDLNAFGQQIEVRVRNSWYRRTTADTKDVYTRHWIYWQMMYRGRATDSR